MKEAESLRPPSSLEDGSEVEKLEVKSDERALPLLSLEEVQGAMFEFVLGKHADLSVAPAAVRLTQLPDVKLVAQCVSRCVCTHVPADGDCNQSSSTRGILSGSVSLLSPYSSTCRGCKAHKSACCRQTSMNNLRGLAAHCSAAVASLCPSPLVVDHMVFHGPSRCASSRGSREGA